MRKRLVKIVIYSGCGAEVTAGVRCAIYECATRHMNNTYNTLIAPVRGGLACLPACLHTFASVVRHRLFAKRLSAYQLRATAITTSAANKLSSLVAKKHCRFNCSWAHSLQQCERVFRTALTLTLTLALSAKTFTEADSKRTSRRCRCSCQKAPLMRTSL